MHRLAKHKSAFLEVTARGLSGPTSGSPIRDLTAHQDAVTTDALGSVSNCCKSRTPRSIDFRATSRCTTSVRGARVHRGKTRPLQNGCADEPNQSARASAASFAPSHCVVRLRLESYLNTSGCFSRPQSRTSRCNKRFLSQQSDVRSSGGKAPSKCGQTTRQKRTFWALSTLPMASFP